MNDGTEPSANTVATEAGPAPDRGGRPVVSIVMPLYNAERTVHAALASVQAQSRPDWELIVADDASRDASAAVVQRLADGDPRIRLLRRGHAGASAARNAGIELARGDWLLFLDSDDWIAEQALELLLETVEHNPEVDCVYADWKTLPADGESFAERYRFDPSERSFFSALSTGCGFPLHAAITRTALVREIGGFDPELVTCEDWDLWLRLARAGATFRSRPGELAFYRTNEGSQSATGRRMLHDALVVIDRAYAADPRVVNPLPGEAAGAPPERRSATRIHHAVYAGGLLIGRGESALEVVELLADDIPAMLFNVEDIGVQLHSAVPRASGSGAALWWGLPAPVTASLDEFIDALDRRTGVRGMARAIRRSIEERVFDPRRPVGVDPGPATLGFTHAITVDLSRPLRDVTLPDGCDRLFCRPVWEGRALTWTTVAAGDGVVGADVLRDACVAPNAWNLVEIMLGEPEDGSGHGDDLWTTFMRALWDRTGWPNARFYDPTAKPGDTPAAVAHRPDEPFVLDVLAPIPDVRCAGDELSVELRIGAEPLWRFPVAVARERVSAQALLVAANTEGGYELCRAAVRVAISGGWRPGTGLRDALAAAREPGPLAAEATAIGQRAGAIPGSAASRRAVLPAAAAETLLADAQAGGEPVRRAGPGPVGYDPSILGASRTHPALAAAAPDPGQVEAIDHNRHFFEALYAQAEDPWGYSSPYEVRKYEQTLELVPEGLAAGLEIACAGGHFTRQLAARVGALDAVDVSALALERAMRRCAGLPNVSFRRTDLFSEELGSRYDVIVCSEVLYYAGTIERVRHAISAMARALAPGGVLVTAHANALVDDPTAPGFDWSVPFGALGIERLIVRSGRFRLDAELYTDYYRVQRFAVEPNRAVRALRARRRPDRRAVAPADAIPFDVRASFHPAGGTVEPDGHRAEPAMPVLMYHRVAPAGAPAMRRWRVTPDELEQQLSYLQEAGYRSATLGEWHTAVVSRRALPGKRITLTFDDGYEDFAEFAAPLLERYGFRAAVFVVTDRVGGVNEWDASVEELPLMGWDTLRALLARGFVIGGHTRTHPHLTTLEDAAVVSEVTGCRAAIRRELGFTPDLFATPYGARDPGIDSLIGACGFQVAVSVDSIPAVPTSPLLRLPRLEVFGEMGFDRFVAALAPRDAIPAS